LFEVKFRSPHTPEECKVIHTGQPTMGQPLTVPLRDYRVDRLIVTVTERAKIRKDRFQYWTMANPTKNFSISFSFPKEHDIQIFPFVLSPGLVRSTKADGYFSARYDFWMLPESGLAWMLCPKTSGKESDLERRPT